MEKQEKTYLVPVDFTPASVSATHFAMEMAKGTNNKIVLLNVIKAERERRNAEQQMQQFTNDHISKYSGDVSSKVVEGSLTKEIAEVVKILNVDLVVMGTHCITGLGKVFRSYAFKIVEDVSVPLIIVQKETVYKDIKKIMMTIDLERESVQIVKMVSSISQAFNSEIILVAKEQTDPNFRSKTDVNMAVCHKILSEKNIPHKFVYVDAKDFVENIFKLCVEENVNLLAATYYQQHVHIFTESFVQTLAYNEFHIPLLTMDEETTHNGTQFGAMWG